MPNLFRKPGTWKWDPSADQFNAPAGTLLRADNLVFDERITAKLRDGSTKIYTGLGDEVHSLYTAYIDGVRYRYAGAGDSIFCNGVDIEVEFDTALATTPSEKVSKRIAMGSWLGTVFTTRGSTRMKHDGSEATRWGLDKPDGKPIVEKAPAVTKYFSNCNTDESPAWSVSEGTATSPYPDGSQGEATGSIELTPDAATGRITIDRKINADGSDEDYWTIQGYTGEDTDIIDVVAWIQKPVDLETLALVIGVSDDADPFVTDQYTYAFQTGGSVIFPPLRSADAVGEMVKRLVRAKYRSPPSKEEEDGGSREDEEKEIERILSDLGKHDNEQHKELAAATNPGWVHFSVPRGSFERWGATPGRNWKTVTGCRIIAKVVSGTTGVIRFDNFLVRGGGTRALTGDFQFAYQAVRSRGGDRQYVEMSQASEPSEIVHFDTQGALITIKADALAALDPNADSIWLYITGGLLDDWYRVAVLDAKPFDDNFNIDEFPRSVDGVISAADRARLGSWGGSIPGSLDIWDPLDISSLTMWLNANDLGMWLKDGDAVKYWPSRSGQDSYGWVPTEIASLECWLRAEGNCYTDNGVTAAVDGDLVQEWTDISSGADQHFRQAVGANKPVYKTGVINGRAALRFDGADDLLESINAASNFLNVASKTIVAVYKSTSNGSSSPDGPGIVSCKDSPFWGMLVGNDTLVCYNYDTGGDVASQSADHGFWAVGTYWHGSASVECGHNNSHSTGRDSTVSNNTSDLDDNAYVGASRSAGAGNFFRGDIAEVLLFDTALNDLDLTRLYRYLSRRYDLPMPAKQHSNLNRGYGAAQYTATNQPTFKAKVPQLKDNGGVYFDGSDNGMITDGLLSDMQDADAGTVFIVAVVEGVDAGAGTGSPNNNTIFGGDGDQSALALYGGTEPYAEAWNDDGAEDYTPAVAILTDHPIVFCMWRDGTDLELGVNDAREASRASVASGNSSSIASQQAIGTLFGQYSGNYPFQGWIAEILTFDAALSEEDCKKVESYLAIKYIPGGVIYPGTAERPPEGESLDRVNRLVVSTPTVAEDTAIGVGDLVVKLPACEIDARVQGIKLPSSYFRPPEEIMGCAGPYAGRYFLLTSDGYVYPSRPWNPSLFKFFHALRVGDATDTALWIKKTRSGIYIGTSKDLWRIYGTGIEYPDGTIDFALESLNVGDPPIDNMVAEDTNILVYRAAYGFMMVVDGVVTPIPMDSIEPLYRGETRYGISGFQWGTDGEFKACLSGAKLYVIVPEGSDTYKSTKVYRFDTATSAWHRFVYSATFLSIYSERDGTVLAGDDSGNVWQLETGTQDESTDIDVTLWAPFDNDGAPLNRKDPFDMAMELDTDGDELVVDIYKDGVTGAAETSVSVSSVLNDVYRSTLTAIGGFRSLAMRMTGSFSKFMLQWFNVSYRLRPQHRFHVDTGYIRSNRERVQWFRVLEICMRAENDVTVTPYFDDTAHAAKTITVTAGKVTVYRVPLGREYKGYAPRVVLATTAAAGTGIDGFELYWIKFKHRRTGDDFKNDVKFAYTDLADALVIKPSRSSAGARGER